MPRLVRQVLMMAIATVATAPCMADQAAPSADRQKELTRFVRQECGFCHGLKLTGGLGTPLTRENMQQRPHDYLVEAILEGVPGTAMPGWKPYLSKQEAAWIAQALQKGFPE